ncbi:MAG: MEDS domain-containing protein [Solirubrobacterales bacterium]
MQENTGIGSRLKATRERLGWNREALAFHSGISWSAIVQIESGRRRNVRASTLSALADALGVSVDYLARGAGPSSPMLEHHALIYDSEERLLKSAGEFIRDAGKRGETVLAVTTETKIEQLRRHLRSEARTVEFVESSAWYSTPGAALDGFRRFCDDSLAGGASWVRVVGEPIWKGRSQSEVEQWTRYESLLNLVFAASPMSILCPYDARSLDPEIVAAASLTHPHTAEEAGAAIGPNYVDPGSFVLDSRRTGRA